MGRGYAIQLPGPKAGARRAQKPGRLPKAARPPHPKGGKR
jgi:hypothetical protein